MDDIVERLRTEGSLKGYYDVPALQREAADEIERLRVQSGQYEELLVELQSICSEFGVYCGEIRTAGIRRVLTEARADNARLRAALEPFAVNTLLPDGTIVGLERWHFERARAALNGGRDD